jgi:hypothetical protein
MPKLTEWEKAQGMRAPKGGKKALPVCHLCGREFGTASLKIHLKACAEKYEREKGKPAPPAPELLDQLTDGDRPIRASNKDWEAYNELAQSAAAGEMEPCPICGRTFSAKDRLAVHMRSCDGSRPAPKSQRGETEAPAAPSGEEGSDGASSKSAKPAKPSLLRRVSSGSLLRRPSSSSASKGSARAGQGKPPQAQAQDVEPAPPTPAGSARGKTAKERMMELKELLDLEMISQAEFDAKRSEILAAL